MYMFTYLFTADNLDSLANKLDKFMSASVLFIYNFIRSHSKTNIFQCTI